MGRVIGVGAPDGYRCCCENRVGISFRGGGASSGCGQARPCRTQQLHGRFSVGSSHLVTGEECSGSGLPQSAQMHMGVGRCIHTREA